VRVPQYCSLDTMLSHNYVLHVPQHTGLHDARQLGRIGDLLPKGSTGHWGVLARNEAIPSHTTHRAMPYSVWHSVLVRAVLALAVTVCWPPCGSLARNAMVDQQLHLPAELHDVPKHVLQVWNALMRRCHA
jgi:hypothetical protein